jgi:hypothetical protein
MVAGARTFTLEDTFLSPQILNPPPTRHALLAFLLALAAVLHIGTAGWGDLYDGVESQVAGGARAMVESGQWLVPTSDGVPLLQTPPLAYWAVALSYKIFGVSATAARVPIALAMIGSVALTFLVGERLAGYWRGFAAGLIQLCSAGAFLPGRMVALDGIYALFISGAIYCAVRGYQHRKFRRTWFAGFWSCASLASLTKGPGALLLLAAIFVLPAIFFREARLRFRPLLHWTNLVLFVLIVTPWFVWAHLHFPGFLSRYWIDRVPGLPRFPILLLHLAWAFPALFFVLPGVIFAPRKILRPNETSFADALPLGWIVVAVLAAMLHGKHHAFSLMAAVPAFALFAACAWERTSRPLRIAGIALALMIGLGVGGLVCLRPASVAIFLDRSLSDGALSSLSRLAQIAIGSLIVFGLGAIFFVKQRAEITLVLALAAMVPIGLCLIESRSLAAPFFSLTDAAQFLNPRLGRNGQVLYEGSLSSGNSLGVYLEKKFFLVNQSPGFFEKDAASRNKYLDEHFVLEAWDRSDPIYLIIDENRVAYWRRLITNRVHIYHQVTTCGSRVVLSNQL